MVASYQTARAARFSPVSLDVIGDSGRGPNLGELARWQRVALILVIFLALASFGASEISAQTRVKPKGPADFAALLKTAQEQWDAKNFAACIKTLKEMMRIANGQRSAVISEALPMAPDGWEKVPRKGADPGANNPVALAMAGAIGAMMEQEYKQVGGKGRIQVKVTTDSPMVNMMSMMFTNPALLKDGSEFIEYGAHKAILKTQKRDRLDLQIVIDGKHLCAIEARGITEDVLFAIFDQAAVDRLAAVLQG